MVLRDDHRISLEGTRINKLCRDLSAHLLQGKCLGHLESSKEFRVRPKEGMRAGMENWILPGMQPKVYRNAQLSTTCRVPAPCP